MSNLSFKKVFFSIIILFVVSFLFFNKSSVASSVDLIKPQGQNQEKSEVEEIKFEVKNFDDQTFFIFYHKEDVKITFSVNNKTDVIASFNKKILVKKINPELISKFCSNIKSNSNNGFSFKINDSNYAKYNQINGEKLTALKIVNQNNLADKKIDDKNDRNNDKNDVNEQNTNVKISQKVAAKNYTIDVLFPKIDNVSVASFIKNENLYVIFDKKINLSFPRSRYLKFEEIKSDKNSTIIKSKIKNLKYARFDKKDDNWILSISSNAKKNINDLNINKDENSVEINIDKKEYGRLIYFGDQLIGEKILVIPTKKPYYGNIKSYKTQDFNLLSSIQGAVVDLYNKDVIVEELDSSIKISSKTMDVVEDSSLKIADNDESSILPFFINDMHEISFTNMREKIMSEIVKSKSELVLYSNRIKLANLYFANQMYSESLSIYKLLEKEMFAYMENDYKNRFVYAVLLSFNEEYSAADQHYGFILGSYRNKLDIPQEVELWANYNEYKFSKSAQIIGMDKKNTFLREYPDNLYWILAEAEIDNALQNQDFAMCELLFKSLRDLSDNKIANSYIYKKALFYNKKGQNDIAKKLLNELVLSSQNYQDPMNYARAEILKVKIDRAQNDITVGDAINKLNDLRFIWRGDDIENDLLINIAQYYKQKEDYVEALRTYANMPNAKYTTEGGDFFIASEVAQMYDEIFKPSGMAENMDDFTVISLFYEFKDYVPIGEQGDGIIFSIINRLVNLELLDSAIDLLDHQVRYRLVGTKKIKAANLLSLIYIMNNQPAQAIKILNETDKESTEYSNYQFRLRLKARAMYDMGQKSKALEYIANDDTEDGMFLRKDIYFKNENWQQYIDLSEGDILKKIDSNDLSAEDFEDIVRLSICYAQLNDNVRLNMIKNKVSKINLSDNKKDLKDNSLFKDSLNAIDYLINPSLGSTYESITNVLKTNNSKVFIDRCKKQLVSN
jgi:hypothetical protein